MRLAPAWTAGRPSRPPRA